MPPSPKQLRYREDLVRAWLAAAHAAEADGTPGVTGLDIRFANTSLVPEGWYLTTESRDGGYDVTDLALLLAFPVPETGEDCSRQLASLTAGRGPKGYAGRHPAWAQEVRDRLAAAWGPDLAGRPAAITVADLRRLATGNPQAEGRWRERTPEDPFRRGGVYPVNWRHGREYARGLVCVYDWGPVGMMPDYGAHLVWRVLIGWCDPDTQQPDPARPGILYWTTSGRVPSDDEAMKYGYVPQLGPAAGAVHLYIEGIVREHPPAGLRELAAAARERTAREEADPAKLEAAARRRAETREAAAKASAGRVSGRARHKASMAAAAAEGEFRARLRAARAAGRAETRDPGPAGQAAPG